MKIFYLFFTCLLFGLSSLQAQQFYSGARISIGQSEFTQVDNSEPLVFLEMGGVASYQYLPWLDLNAEALLAWQGSGYSGTQEVDETLGFTRREEFEGEIRNLALKIPLYPAVSFGSENIRLRLQAGPALSFNFFGRQSRDFVDANEEDISFEDFEDYDPLTFSVLYGIGVRIKTESGKVYQLDFRYNNGLSDLVNLEYLVQPRDARLDYWTISGSYLLGQ